MNILQGYLSTTFMKDPNYEECKHCNGYGSSLKEDADTCTRCNGTGLVKKEVKDEETL